MWQQNDFWDLIEPVIFVANDFEIFSSGLQLPCCTTSVAIGVCCYAVAGVAGMFTCGILLMKIAPVSHRAAEIFAAVARNQ